MTGTVLKPLIAQSVSFFETLQTFCRSDRPNNLPSYAAGIIVGITSLWTKIPFIPCTLIGCLLRSSWTQCCPGPCGFFFLQPLRAGSGILTDPRSWPCQPDLCCSASLCKFSHQSCWKWTPRGRITQLTQGTEGTNTASHAVQHGCLCQYGTKPQNTDSPVSLLLSVWGSLLRCAYTLALCDGRTHSFSGPLNMSLGSRSIRSPILCPVPLLQLLALILAIPDAGLTS